MKGFIIEFGAAFGIIGLKHDLNLAVGINKTIRVGDSESKQHPDIRLGPIARADPDPAVFVGIEQIPGPLLNSR